MALEDRAPRSRAVDPPRLRSGSAGAVSARRTNGCGHVRVVLPSPDLSGFMYSFVSALADASLLPQDRFPRVMSAPCGRRSTHATTACDQCFRLKVRCDAASPRCTSCERLQQKCTYLRPDKRRCVASWSFVFLRYGCLVSLGSRASTDGYNYPTNRRCLHPPSFSYVSLHCHSFPSVR